MLLNSEDVNMCLHCIKPLRMKYTVTLRLDMTMLRIVEVQRPIEDYSHSFNFTPQQNKQQKGCVLET